MIYAEFKWALGLFWLGEELPWGGMRYVGAVVVANGGTRWRWEWQQVGLVLLLLCFLAAGVGL